MNTQQAHDFFNTTISVAKIALNSGDTEFALGILQDLTDNDEVIDILYEEDLKEMEELVEELEELYV
jgi:hypothetical protein